MCFKVSLDPEENVIRVFLGLMVNQEFQESASLGPLDLRVNVQILKHRVYCGYLENIECVMSNIEKIHNVIFKIMFSTHLTREKNFTMMLDQKAEFTQIYASHLN